MCNIPRNANFFCLCSAHAPRNAVATQIGDTNRCVWYIISFKCYHHHTPIDRSWPYWRHHKRMQLCHKKEGENSDIQLLSSQYFSFVNFKREISNFSFFLSAKPHYSFGDRRWLQFLSNTSSIQYLIEVSGVNSIHQGLVVQKVIDLIQD